MLMLDCTVEADDIESDEGIEDETKELVVRVWEDSVEERNELSVVGKLLSVVAAAGISEIPTVTHSSWEGSVNRYGSSKS